MGAQVGKELVGDEQIDRAHLVQSTFPSLWPLAATLATASIKAAIPGAQGGQLPFFRE